MTRLILGGCNGSVVRHSEGRGAYGSDTSFVARRAGFFTPDVRTRSLQCHEDESMSSVSDDVLITRRYMCLVLIIAKVRCARLFDDRPLLFESCRQALESRAHGDVIPTRSIADSRGLLAECQDGFRTKIVGPLGYPTPRVGGLDPVAPR